MEEFFRAETNDLSRRSEDVVVVDSSAHRLPIVGHVQHRQLQSCLLETEENKKFLTCGGNRLKHLPR